jgi:ubiquinone/menaquinone biosynthesis C-methylase UbiE
MVEVRDHFDREASTYASAYHRSSNSGYSFRIRKQRVLELFDKPGGAVLDAGCGPGVLVDELVRGQGCELWGVDVSPEMIDRARERHSGLERVHFGVGDVESLPFQSGFFDAAIAMGVLEYLPHSGPALQEMFRVLKPGGTLIVTLPNAVSPFRVWQRFVWKPVLFALRPLVGRWFPVVKRLTSPVNQREFEFMKHRLVYERMGGSVEDVVYYNFKPFPSPLDYLLRGLQHRISARLESQCRSRLRFIGTGFIVKVRNSG